MSAGLPLVLPLLTGASLWLAGSLVAALPLGAAVRALDRLAPPQRSWLLLVYSVYPLVVAVATTLAIFSTPLSSLAVGAHCHGGACGAHVPAVSASGATAIAIVGVVLTALTLAALVVGSALWRSARITRMVAALARYDDGCEFGILDDNGIMACCIGIVRSNVIVSRGLAERASPAQLEIVLLHERAHLRRLDNLRNLIASLVTLPWPERSRIRLLAALQAAAEQSCDEAASHASGNRRRVLETLKAVHAWQRDRSARCADGSVEARLDALNGGTWNKSGPHAWLALLGALLMAQLILMPDAIHHLAETILALL